jgi:predicted aldo/keto reductase-like oxidoreductase
VLEDAKKAGRIKHIGVTSHQIDVAKAAVTSGRFETIMFALNFITCEAATELLPLTRAHDVGFIAMKPMAGGRLQNAALAFKYLFRFPDVLPIPGIENVHEIEEIVQLLEGHQSMTPSEQTEMERLRNELGNRFCRRCEYCHPCTAGISISSVMSFPMFFNLRPRESLFSGQVCEFMEKAADCAECGDCEERCPYHLPIRQMISEYVSWYLAERNKLHPKIS